MIETKDHHKVQVQLQAFLAERLDDVTVRVGDDLYFPGTNVVVTSPAFRGLLPEQRFHHVVRAIPPTFYEQSLHGKVVWFELAPGETGRDLMEMPRSDDIAQEVDDILERLASVDFFQALPASLSAPQEASIDDFTASRRLLVKAGFNERDVTRACLLFIRHGAFCDAQLLTDVLPELAADHAA